MYVVPQHLSFVVELPYKNFCSRLMYARHLRVKLSARVRDMVKLKVMALGEVNVSTKVMVS